MEQHEHLLIKKVFQINKKPHQFHSIGGKNKNKIAQNLI